MASTIKWGTPGTFTTLLSTELNALAYGAATAVGTAFDNLANLFLFGDFQLSCTFAANATAGANCDLYLIPATDGTNYNDGSASLQPPPFCRGSWVLANQTTQLLSIQGVPLPPCPFKAILYNNGGQAMAASGHTVKMLPYNYQTT